MAGHAACRLFMDERLDSPAYQDFAHVETPMPVGPDAAQNLPGLAARSSGLPQRASIAPSRVRSVHGPGARPRTSRRWSSVAHSGGLPSDLAVVLVHLFHVEGYPQLFQLPLVVFPYLRVLKIEGHLS